MTGNFFIHKGYLAGTSCVFNEGIIIQILTGCRRENKTLSFRTLGEIFLDEDIVVGAIVDGGVLFIASYIIDEKLLTHVLPFASADEEIVGEIIIFPHTFNINKEFLCPVENVVVD